MTTQDQIPQENSTACIDATCTNCGAIFCRHCEGNFCPQCGKQFQLRESGLPRHINDFRRNSFLCCLLHMFSDTDSFQYRIERKDTQIQIWLYNPASLKQDFAHLRFDDDQVKFADDFRKIIQQIVFFNVK